MKTFADSDIGLVRKTNEDAHRTLIKERFFVLADGMGGHKAGDVASKKAVEYYCNAVQNLQLFQKSDYTHHQLRSLLCSIMENTNLWIHHLGNLHPAYQGMGTTLSSLLFLKDSCIMAHIGDSRIYRLRDQKITQLSTDHAYVAPRQEGAGVLSSKGRRVLSQALGTHLSITPEVLVHKTQPGDLYVLCSDGLSDILEDTFIERLLNKPTPLSDKGKELIDSAKARGGHDNITLVLVEVE